METTCSKISANKHNMLGNNPKTRINHLNSCYSILEHSAPTKQCQWPLLPATDLTETRCHSEFCHPGISVFGFCSSTNLRVVVC
jgi:hypothetical protein